MDHCFRSRCSPSGWPPPVGLSAMASCGDEPPIVTYREAASSRYIISGTLMVRVEDPALVQKASQNVGELAQTGVVITSGSGFGTGPTYLYTKLNDLKPPMIVEATASAREAAEQFAKDSGSHLGPIRQASQGVFQILPRDRAPGVPRNRRATRPCAS